MPREDKKQHFKVLGLDSSATECDVRQAYSKLVLQNHPQKSSGGGSESTFEDVSKAFRFLTEMDGECSKADNDQIFLNFFRDLLGSANHSWPEEMFQKARAADADFDYRSPDEDDIELDGENVDCLIDIIDNYKKRGKNIPVELSSEKLEWCREQLQQKDECKRDNSKKSVKKSKAATSVPVAKTKPKSKKQLLAEQRKREREIEQIALELEGKRKEEEEREKQRKQLEVEKQKRQEEERIKAQAEARKQREREEKERERQRKNEQEKEERRRKQQEDERRRKEEEEKRKKSEKEKAEKEKQVRMKAQQVNKEKEDQLKSQSLKNQTNKKSVQQQQRTEQNMYPREIPPRFQKKMKQQQQSQPITQSQPVVTAAKQSNSKPAPAVSRKKDPNRWTNNEFTGIISHKEDDGGWSQGGPAQGSGWLDYNHVEYADDKKWGTEIAWGGKESSWDNVVVDSKDDESWPSVNGTKLNQSSSKAAEAALDEESEWTDKKPVENTPSWGSNTANNVSWTGQLNQATVGIKTQSPIKAHAPSSSKPLPTAGDEKSSPTSNVSTKWGGPSPSGWGGIIPYSENWDSFCDDSVDAAIDAVETSQTLSNGPDMGWNKLNSSSSNSWTKPKPGQENNGSGTISESSLDHKMDNTQQDSDSSNTKSNSKDWSKTPGKVNNTKGSGWNDIAPPANTWENTSVSVIDSVTLPTTDTNKFPVGTHKAPGASTLGWGSSNQPIIGSSAKTKTKVDSNGHSGVLPNPASIAKPPVAQTPASVPIQSTKSNSVNTKVSLAKEKKNQSNTPVWGEPQAGSTGWGDAECWDTTINNPDADITGTSCWDQAVNRNKGDGEKSPLNMATPTTEKVTGWLESNPPASGWSEVEDIDVTEAWGGGWTTASSKRNKAPKTAPVASDSNAWMTRPMKQLLDMGFKQEDAEKALKANHMNIESAISDLLTMAASCDESVQTPGLDEPPTEESVKSHMEEPASVTEPPKLNRKQRRRLQQQLAQQEENNHDKSETLETKTDNSQTKQSNPSLEKTGNSKDSKVDPNAHVTESSSTATSNSSTKTAAISTNGPILSNTVPQTVRPPLPQQFLQQQLMQQQLQFRFAQAGLMQSPALNPQQLVMLQQLAQLQMMQQRLAQSAAQQQIAQKQVQMKPTLQQQQLALMIGQIQQQITLQQQQLLARTTPQQQPLLQHQQQQIQQLILQQQQKAQQHQQHQQQEPKQTEPVDQPPQNQSDVNEMHSFKPKDTEQTEDPPTSVSATSSLPADVNPTTTPGGNDLPKSSPSSHSNDVILSQHQSPLNHSRLQQWKQPIPNAEIGKKESPPIPKEQGVSEPVSINTVIVSSAAPGSYSPLLASSLSPVKAGLPKESISSRWGVDASLRLSADPPEFKPGVPWKPREFRDDESKEKIDDNASMPSPSSASSTAADSVPGSLSSSSSSLARPSPPEKVVPIGTAPARSNQESLGSSLANLNITSPFSDPMWRAPAEKILPKDAVTNNPGPVRPPPGLNGKNSFVNPPGNPSPQSTSSHLAWGSLDNVKAAGPSVGHNDTIFGGLGYGSPSPWGTGHNFHPFNSNTSSGGSWPASSQPPHKPPSDVPINTAPGQAVSGTSSPGSSSPGQVQKDKNGPVKVVPTSNSVNPPRMVGAIPGAAGNPNQMSTWLVLRNLSPRIDTTVLRSLCQQHGPLLTFQLNLRHGNSLIRYSSKEEAASARNMLNSTPVCGESITASFATDADIGSFFDQSSDWSNNPVPSGPFHSGAGWPPFGQSPNPDDIKKYPVTQQAVFTNNQNPLVHAGKVPLGMTWGTAPVPMPNSYAPQTNWSFSQYGAPGSLPPPVGNLWSSRNDISECHDVVPQESGLTSPSMTTFLPPGLLNGSESM